jgi:thymidine kinase
MAKLYFRYGSVGSAKTMNLLAVVHNYESQSKKALLVKPKLDTRFGETNVKSRAGLERIADVLFEDDTVLSDSILNNISCVLVDEAQFLSTASIDHLRFIATIKEIPVICYGLRTDFRGQLFDGSKRLFEVADSFEEIKTTCHYCNRKAIFNMKLVEGRPTLAGPKVELGTEEKYLPTCALCYRTKLEDCYLSSRSES